MSLDLDSFEDKRILEAQKNIGLIVDIYRDHNFFWKNAYGWAPDEADQILSKSRLDWLFSLSEALYLWTETYITTSDSDGKLILAWANLGALLEGGLKLFLSVYYLDYEGSEHHIRQKGKIKSPDRLGMNELKNFITKQKLFDKKWIDFIDVVQKRRNAIHAYRDREIGDWDEFFNSIELLRDFTVVIKNSLLITANKMYQL